LPEPSTKAQETAIRDARASWLVVSELRGK
jgi:hypothetical protein